MRLEDLPHGGYRVAPAELDATVAAALRQLTGAWALDPARLAVACYAQCWRGQAAHWLGEDVAEALRHDGRRPGTTYEEGHDVVRRALARRREAHLRDRARGLLLALEATAPAYERDRVHAVQVSVGVRECRPATPAERALRSRGRGEVVDATH